MFVQFESGRITSSPSLPDKRCRLPRHAANMLPTAWAYCKQFLIFSAPGRRRTSAAATASCLRPRQPAGGWADPPKIANRPLQSNRRCC